MTVTPTPFPEVNELLRLLHARMGAVLGAHLLALYLDGSLARGGFDAASDIDFVAVVPSQLDDTTFAALQQMHAAIGQLDYRLARDIEGFYVPLAGLRRYDPANSLFANLERGATECLKWEQIGQAWIVHRYILREYGLVLAGPPPASLIDAIPPSQLQSTMRTALQEWSDYVLAAPHLLTQPGYQSYAVLTLCRMVYTLQHADILPKAQAAAWGMTYFPARWQPLISQALHERLHLRAPTPQQTAETVALVDYVRGLKEREES